MLRVLVVDDEGIQRKGIIFLLNKNEHDFEIIEASTGEEALDIIVNNQIDIIITDIRMPKMSGLELIERAKKNSA